MAMLASLFISRVALSVFMFGFVIFSLTHQQHKKQITTFFKHPLLWGMSLLFLLPFISGLWSINKEAWLDVVRVKLPLLLLPFAFATPFQFSKKEYKLLAYFSILLVCAGSAWSIFQYLNNIQEVNAGYLQAKSLCTPLEKDRVRFSWMVAVAAWMSGYLFFKNKQRFRWLYLVAAAWLIIYLHILAVRTGIISFYLAMIVTAVYFIFKKRSSRYSLLLISSIIILPLIAYFALPSFQNRMKYLFYEFGYFKEAHYLPGGNDAMRVISIKAGWNILKENPVTGVGFGDIQKAANEFYEKEYPQMQQGDNILPSSEWMLYGAGTGILGFIIFTTIMLIPFFLKTRERLSWWIINTMAAFSFLFDIGLEVQMGVFIYTFVILCWWKWLSAEKM